MRPFWSSEKNDQHQSVWVMCQTVSFTSQSLASAYQWVDNWFSADGFLCQRTNRRAQFIDITEWCSLPYCHKKLYFLLLNRSAFYFSRCAVSVSIIQWLYVDYFWSFFKCSFQGIICWGLPYLFVIHLSYIFYDLPCHSSLFYELLLVSKKGPPLLWYSTSSNCDFCSFASISWKHFFW